MFAFKCFQKIAPAIKYEYRNILTHKKTAINSSFRFFFLRQMHLVNQSNILHFYLDILEALLQFSCICNYQIIVTLNRKVHCENTYIAVYKNNYQICDIRLLIYFFFLLYFKWVKPVKYFKCTFQKSVRGKKVNINDFSHAKPHN